ncbi:hypothetical protein NMG29_05755 [Streptomyces cocklensis]|uniref:Uncharacterized protein n=1 Tax=Actinacidiphila cocklensis TaxID=887465 RepID=A0A9W4GVZ4_9ACTN|nr:hypothetical protein [Actinacidiphila cocklensis]MDD1057737.1 hypothetical protein [Actinacidiphila cocklensis]CAG6398443.1 conserved exported hypothetical protein [Actinacidiphila cocklensis]
MTTTGNGRAASALAVSAAVAAAAALTGGPPATAATTTAPHVRAIAAPVAKTVTLVTGQRVRVDMEGQRVTAYRVLPGQDTGGALLSFGVGDGDRYTLPADAMPEIGGRLDLSLFDVTALARQTAGDGRIPVTLDFAAGATPTAPPGVRLTSVDGSTATGYLTPASAAAFAGAVRGRTLPEALGSVRLSGAPGAAAHPDFPLHTLQINATGLAGAPADTPMGSIVLNTDDVSRFGTAVPVDGGEGNVQVPAGHYAIYTVFLDHDAKGSAVAYREVAQNATVADGAGTTTVAADESAADKRVTVTTPRPATADLLKLTWFRKGPTGIVSFDSVQIGDPSTEAVYVNSQPAAPGGSRYVVQWGGSAPDGGAYRYDLAFGSDDVPADESFAARADRLATVEQHFSADPAGGDFPGAFYVLPVSDWTRAVEAAGQAVLAPPVDPGRTSIPGNRTEYLGTADGGSWLFSELTPQLGTFESDITSLAAGTTRRIDWGHGPLAPALGAHRDQQLRDCTACAGDGLFSLYLPTGDSEPDHIGSTATGTHFTLYQNGAKVVDEADVVGAQVPAAAGPTTYRAVYDTDLTATGATQSTRTHTDLTFRDTGRADPDLALPADVPCPETGCRIMPALTLAYRLDSDQSNTSALADQTMDLTVGHLSYDGHGSLAAITSAAVSVSFDGGATWQAATLTGTGGGTYHASWRNTGTTAPVLKVTATDAAGGSLAQTVTDAYTLAAGGLR